MIAKFIFLGSIATLSVASLLAQSSTPIIVQAIPPPATKATTAPATQAPPSSMASGQATLKLLQELKATNEAVLAKQAATLGQLEELEKAAEQIRIYSKRG